jgi:hypothetical protein
MGEPRRLVIMPLCSADVERGRIVLECIERGSTLPGETWIAWNDTQPPPDWLAKGWPVKVYPKPLGWCGISVAIAEGFRLAMERGFEWAFKIDSDTAIIRRGWDAALIAGAPNRPVIAGAIVQVPWSIEGNAQRVMDAMAPRLGPWKVVLRDGTECPVLLVQGGLYAVNRGMLEVIEQRFGLVPQGGECYMGEDILLSQKATRAVGDKNWCYRSLAVHQPQNAGDPRVHAVHPVKLVDAMRWFCRDVLSPESLMARMEGMAAQLKLANTLNSAQAQSDS